MSGLNLRMVRERLFDDRRQIDVFNFSAELMREHASEHERDATRVAKQRKNLIRTLCDKFEDTDDFPLLCDLLAEFGFEPQYSEKEGKS